MPRRPTRPWQAERYGKDRDRAERPGAGRRGPRVRVVDLHRYDVKSAAELALTAVHEAYLNGFQMVELVHGAADVTTPVEPGGGRGAIKFELRRMLAAGEFDAFCRARNEHQQMEGSLRLALKPNPQPRSESWTPPPPATHA
jgi:hypothetical protein